MKKITMMIAIVLFVFSLSACGSKGTNPHTLTYEIDNIHDVVLSYDDEDITFFESPDDTLIIKEYMTDADSKYYAKVDIDQGYIHVSEGGKPLFGSFSRHIEVYFPKTYTGSLTVTSTNGNVDFSEVDIEVTSLRIDCSSGKVRIRNAYADTINLSSTSGTLDIGHLEGKEVYISTTSGKVVCDEISGNVTYVSTSGDIEIESAVGAGSYKTENSGILDITYTDVAGDLYLYNKNGDVELTLPEDLSFRFEAVTKNGSVSTPFESVLSMKNDTVTGTVGGNPSITVKTETKNGNIKVEQ